MLEMKIKIEVADALISAIDKLASALNITAIPTQTPAPAAPANPTAVPAPVTAPASAPVQAASTSPIADPTPAQPPVQMNAAMTAPTPAPVVPVTAAPTYTLDQIATAGAALVNAGKMEQLLALLGKYGIQAITQLKAEQFGQFVTELRGLGAQI
jgi:hypothetical protein